MGWWWMAVPWMVCCVLGALWVEVVYFVLGRWRDTDWLDGRCRGVVGGLCVEELR